MKRVLSLLVFLCAAWGARAEDAVETPAISAPSDIVQNLPPKEKVTFYVIPVREEIGPPVLYIIRTGVKEAVAARADFVVLDIDTLGGELGATLEIMEALEKFKGRTVAFVNDKAISAGAFISAAAQDIYFAPRATIGAAAAVSSTGEDIEQTMKEKVRSFLSARIRAISEGRGYRSEVVTAMMDMDYEFKIGETVINPKGKLLTLTANEAMKTYGEPPQALLGAGIAENLTALQHTLAAGAPFEVREFHVTWSIKLFRWFNAITPLLIGLGILGIVLEFQVGGHGWLAGLGVGFLLLVFVGNNVAGLSGHEPILICLLGVVLILIEVFFFPGIILFGVAGGLMILGSLLWSMADIWPADAFELNPGMFLAPAYQLALGLLVAMALIAASIYVLPKTGVGRRMVLQAEISGLAGGPVTVAAAGLGGVVVSPLRPTGTVEIGGERYEARSELGELAVGTPVRVVRRDDFVLIVEPVER